MEPMPAEEAAAMLKASRLGILSLAEGGRAYAIPLFFSYDGESVWFQCHPGLKDEYIDTTEEACLDVIHFESEHVWESVQVFGKVEKVTLSDEREKAEAALIGVPFPPMEGNYPQGMPIRSDRNMYYLCLKPDRIAGMQSAFHAPEKGA